MLFCCRNSVQLEKRTAQRAGCHHKNCERKKKDRRIENNVFPCTSNGIRFPFARLLNNVKRKENWKYACANGCKRPGNGRPD